MVNPVSISLANRPVNVLDCQGRVIYDSVDDLAFRAEYDGSNNMIYKGFARPGALPGASVWQIAKLTYDGSNNLVSITWPQNSFNEASNDYLFEWDERASYTYS